ncbi:transcription antitermination factor NusB [Candidatus Endolissoclinum faulkneri]|nr:transcription antitermination factor NusB [Candidatus Endolissoclinum faulkneri]
MNTDIRCLNDERRDSRTLARRLSRLAAAQAMYEIEITQSSPHEVVQAFFSFSFASINDYDTSSQVDALFFKKLVINTVHDTPTLDPILITALEPDFTLHRLEVLLRSILRLGTCELLSFSDIPAKVIITQYVEIGRDFFFAREPALVNAVLDQIARLVRKSEI